ncbi:MAG: hypothetical protein ACFFEA_13870 [Candidatus Thorarchaeota archaeon]
MTISVFDSNDNKLSHVFGVTVRPPVPDSTASSWVIASLKYVIEFGEPFEFQLGAWDASGIDHWRISDSDNSSIDTAGSFRNATQLAIDVYRSDARAYDPHGNYCSATLTVVVVDSS